MKITFSGSYLKADEAKKGEVITILDSGKEQLSKFKYEDGNTKTDYLFKVEYMGEEKVLRMNANSRRAMVEAFGDDTENWIGKKAKLFIMPTPNGDKKMIVLDPILEEQAV